MKNIITKSLLFGASAILSFACQDNQEGNLPTPESAISFTSAINTKANETAFEAGDQIGVTAFSDAALTTIYADNVTYTFGADGIFSATDPILADGELLYAAIYPVQSGAYQNETPFTVLADQTTPENLTLSDLMLAKTAATDELIPELVFDHKLSRILVEVEANIELDGAVVKVVGTKTGATLDVAQSTVVAAGEAADVTLGVTPNDEYAAILVPQSLASGADFITVTVDGETYTATLEANAKLESGKSYRFNMVIEVEEEDVDVTLTSEIVGWEDGDLYAGGETGGGDEGGSGDDASNFTSELADVPQDGATIVGDVWVLTDDVVDYNDLANLRKALGSAGREISVEFPNLTSGLLANFFDGSDWMVSFSAPLVTSTEMSTFRALARLKTVSLPSLTYGDFATFNGCTSLETITMCVNGTVELFDSMFFYKSAESTTITLYTGAKAVTGVGAVGAVWSGITFKEVIVVE